MQYTVIDITDRKVARPRPPILQQGQAMERREAAGARRAQTPICSSSAYVAAYDLQGAVVRMVASYSLLLSKRYKGRLDAEADQYIDFAVNGVPASHAAADRRPTGLLPGRHNQQGIAGNRHGRCPATGPAEPRRRHPQSVRAVVTNDPLPVLAADHAQLVQLFQNIVGNAIKSPRSGNAARPRLRQKEPRGGVGVRHARQRPGHRAAAFRDDLRHVPEAAWAPRVFRHRHRPDPLSQDRRASRRAHVGRVAPGAGSTFYLALPERLAAHATEPAADAQAA